MQTLIVVPQVESWHFSLVKTSAFKPSNSAVVETEVRQMRATGKRIAANRKLALRFLAATGMYTAGGKLKPQFR